MDAQPETGFVVTFYSFKGGVGRTMALANVAFLTALNGYRVLVMDWDLEAPGASYYFRGLLEAAEASAMRDAPGVLDLLWDWRTGVQAAKNGRDLERLFHRFSEGGPFQERVRPILGPERLEAGGRLDFMSAGALKISTPDLISYEEALGLFDWQRFFDQEAGGLALDSLRAWAKSQYDYIFVDSRTGLADVAGICTMQLPDAVALCFILNRQNIDGVARVAQAVRSRREDQVQLRAVPMRVGGGDTSEESDARARATHVLTRIGEFSAEAVQNDFKLLSVQAAPNVPFYETLAPFTASDPRLNPLVLNYLTLGTHLLKRPLQLVDFDPAWIEMVRRRLQPRLATVEYVRKLTSADEVRAVGEIEGLIDNAYEAISEGQELSNDYVSALVDATLALLQFAEDPLAAVHLLNRALDLLRALANRDPALWRDRLIESIQRGLEDANYFLESEEELALLEELDGLIASAASLPARLARLHFRRKAARLYVGEKNLESAKQTIGEIEQLISKLEQLKDRLTPEQQDEVTAARVDVAVLRGDAYQQDQLMREAYDEYRAGLSMLPPHSHALARAELLRLGFDLFDRLGRAAREYVPPEDAAAFALEAARWGAGTSGLVLRFADLAAAIVRAPLAAEKAADFCAFALSQGEGRLQLQLANYYGRHPASAAVFLQRATDLSRAMASGPPERASPVLPALVTAVESVCRHIDRRRQTLPDEQRAHVAGPLAEFIAVVSATPAPPAGLDGLRAILASLGPRRGQGA